MTPQGGMALYRALSSDSCKEIRAINLFHAFMLPDELLALIIIALHPNRSLESLQFGLLGLSLGPLGAEGRSGMGQESGLALLQVIEYTD